jgi:Integrase core domain
MSRACGPAIQTILFQTLYVLFVVRHINREILHVAVTPFPTAACVAQQVVECCAWDRLLPRFLIHDRDNRYGATFDRRLRHLGIEQVRTPFRAPRANAISERRVKSVRTECLDHILVFNEVHLRRAISAYVVYFNYWRPHRSLGQRAPCESTVRQFRHGGPHCEITAEPVRGGLHHIYRRCCMMAGVLRPSGSGCGRSHKATQVRLTVIWRKPDLRRGGRRPDAHLTPAPAPTSKEPSRRSCLTVAQGR